MKGARSIAFVVFAACCIQVQAAPKTVAPEAPKAASEVTVRLLLFSSGASCALTLDSPGKFGDTSLPPGRYTLLADSVSPGRVVHHAFATVLVMDDELPIRKLAVQLLQRIGCTAETAADGAEAIELYESARQRGEPFGAVIMDLTVPNGMGGKDWSAGIVNRYLGKK